MDRDQNNAPYSPWGRIQGVTKIVRGVRFVSTARHGGLMITRGAAEKHLSAAAVRYATSYGGYLCFEEDCLCSIPFYENPEWLEKLVAGKSSASKEELEQSIRQWTPGYFRGLETC